MSAPLHELLARWLEAYRGGSDLSAHDLCADQPALAEELSPILERLRRANGLADLKPATEATATVQPGCLSNGASSPTVPPVRGDSLAVQAEGVPGYEILEELGRGGMGVVYKARQVSLGRIVALKMILAGGHAGKEQLARFKTEAEAIARLQHPNIVQVHEVGEREGMPYFSLEFCDGGSLDCKLAGAPLPPEQAAKLTETLARAMGAAHRANVIHRDLKPANILLSFSRDAIAERGEVGALRSEDSASRLNDVFPKITDFGLAKKLDEAGQTQTGAVMGTPSYMAPEQAGGKSKDIGPLADVYALGAILYECLTGRPPFKAATALDTLVQVVSEEPVPPRQLNAKVPADLETICLKCLRKEPGKRYATGEELAEDLARWQRGEPVLARPVSATERAVKWARRRPAVAGLLAAIVVLTALALGVTTGLYREAVEEAERAQKAETRAEEERDNAKEQERAAREQEGIARDERNKTKVEKDRAEEQLDRAERLRYASQIQAAHREWEAGNTGLAWEHLESCRWDYRGIEYRYLYTLFTHNHTTLQGHKGWVLSVAISADGKRIVSGGWDRTVKVWDATTGQHLRTLQGHTAAVLAVAISSDGKRIVSASSDDGVKVWDLNTGKELLSFRGRRASVSGVAISPDGRRIVIGGVDKTVHIHEATTGKHLRTLKGHTDAVTGVAISADGKRIVSGSLDKTVKVWDAHTGKALLTLEGHTRLVQSVAISGDGKRIVSGSHDQTVKVWDAITGKGLLTLEGHTPMVLSVAFSGDGRRIVSGGGDGMVKVWDTATGKQLLSLKGHTGPVSSVTMSVDGKRIVSASWDKTMKVWDVASRHDFLSLNGYRGGVSSVAISPDGKHIVTGSDDKTVKLQDAASGKVLLSLEGHTEAVSSVAISRDGKRIVSGSLDKTVKLWDVRTGKTLRTLVGHANFVSCVAISPDGNRIISGSWDPTVKVWDAHTGKALLTLEGQNIFVSSVAISADGRRIVSGGADDTVKVRDAATGKVLLSLKGEINGVSSVAISADGKRIVGGGGDGTVKQWDATTGKELLSLKGHTNLVLGVAFSSDGKRIVSGGGSTVKVWDAVTGKDLLTLEGRQTDMVSSVAISADGNRIVSGSGNLPGNQPGKVKVWFARASNERLFLKGHTSPLARVAVSADGKRVLGEDAAGKIIAWDAASGQLLPDPPARMPAGGRETSSANGKLRVSIEGEGLRVHRPDLDEAREQREARDRERLDRLARFDPEWHRNQLDDALRASDDFAAAFHLDRLVRGVQLPWDRGPRGTSLENEKDAKVATRVVSWTLAARWEKPAADAFLEQARRNLARQRNAATLHFHGVALYRAGQSAEAERSLAESVKAQGTGGYADTWLFQAIVARQRGKQAEAERLLARFEDWHGKRKFTSWQQKAYWQTLLTEARKLLLTPAAMAKVAAGE
jgi:WD40 repeat protein